MAVKCLNMYPLREHISIIHKLKRKKDQFHWIVLRTHCKSYMLKAKYTFELDIHIIKWHAGRKAMLQTVFLFLFLRNCYSNHESFKDPLGKPLCSWSKHLSEFFDLPLYVVGFILEYKRQYSSKLKSRSRHLNFERICACCQYWKRTWL